MKGFVLFIVGVLCSVNSFAQPTLLNFTLESYGPFLKEYDDEFSLSVENLANDPINVSVQFTLERFGNVLMETGAGLSPVVEALPNTVTDYHFYTDGGVDPFVFYNQSFKDSLDSFLMPINSNCKISATLYYDLGEGFVESNSLVVQVQDILPTPISRIFPNDNDTLYSGSKMYSFRWDDLKLAPGYQTKYNFKLYEVYTGQTVNQALLNPPLVDEVIDVANSYKWHPLSGKDTIIWDSTYDYSRHLVWTVGNVIPTGFDQSSYSTLKVSEFYLDDILLPSFSPGDDTLEFYHKCYAKGFEHDLIDEITWDTPIPAKVPKISPSYKNLSCPNGDAEDGTFKGWTGATGKHSLEEGRSVTVLDNPGIRYDPGNEVLSDHYIYTVRKNDQHVPPLKTISPLGGSHSIRLGDDAAGDSEAASLEYEFTVNSSNEDFQFLYAVVLLEPDDENEKQPHLPEEMPYFSYSFYNVTDGEEISSFKVIADKENEQYFKRYKASQALFLYKDWTCVGVDFSAYYGKTVKATFVTADCTRGAHYGYAYIDGLCDNFGPIPDFQISEEFCIEDDIVADGSATQFEMDYRWTIEESDQFWGRNPSTEVFSDWYLGQEVPDNFYISDLIKELGVDLKCDQYYRIKLIARNDCDDFAEDVKLIYIKPCFKADAGPDKSICFNETNAELIGKIYSPPYPPGYSQTTFSWSHDALVQSSYDYVLPSNSVNKYVLTTTLASNGCVSKDSVMVFVQDGPNYAVGMTDHNLCDDKGGICVEIYSHGRHRFFINGVNPGVGFDHTVTGPGTFCFDNIDFGNSARADVLFYIVDECAVETDSLVFVNFDEGASSDFGIPDIDFYAHGVASGTFLEPRNTAASIYERELFVWDVHNFTLPNSVPISPLNSYAYNAHSTRLEVFHRWGINLDEELPISMQIYTPEFGMGLYNGQVRYNLRFGGELVPAGTYDFMLYLNRCGPKEQYNWYPKKWVLIQKQRPCVFCPKVDTEIEATLIGIKVD